MTSKHVRSLDTNYKDHLTRIENELKQLQYMQEKCNTLNESYETTKKLQEELKRDKNDVLERLHQLRVKDRDLRKERLSLEAEINTALTGVDKIPSEELEELYNILGYHIIESRLMANSEMEWTLQYMEFDNYIKFSIGDTYELIDIQPELKNFSKIKLFFRQTQDLSGLLNIARKYFIIKVLSNTRKTMR